MTIRHLDSLFDPASVAVIGASTRPMSVGTTVWRNLREGGFGGPRWAVNPRHTQIDGEPCFASVAQLPAAPELAVIAIRAAAVPALVAELGARGTKAVVVLSAGLTTEQQQAMLDAARLHMVRVLGPNGLGLLSPHARLNASFAPSSVGAGGLAFVSQSGALCTAMIDWARGRGIGFSLCVSMGEQADVDFADLLDWLASDARTQAVLLYIESIKHARKFMSAARAAARNKPVLVVKAGRSPQGQAAAASHTGALAAADLVFDAAIRRAGMLRVQTLDELFVAAETLAHLRRQPLAPRADADQALTVVTNGGGAGVLAADAAAAAGVRLAPLSSATQVALESALPANWSRANPVDIIGDAPVARYVSTLQTLLADPAAGSVLFIHAPTAIVPSADIAQALLPLAQQAQGRLLSVWLGDAAVKQAREVFRAAGVPTYDTAEQAVAAFAMLCTYRANQQQLSQAPPMRVPGQALELGVVRQLIDNALQQGREWLSEPEAKAVLAACGVPVVATQQVALSADAAVAAARQIGYPVALKIVSPQISHKSDIGGVALGLDDEAALRQAAATMQQRVSAARPGATLSGFAVQAMVLRTDARELIVGTSIDPLFGPVLLFGQGGRAVEVLADRAIGLPPLNLPLAQALIERTRASQLLAAWRDVPAADHSAIAQVLVALSQLLAEEPRISELDINPLLADAQGVLALDARVRVSVNANGGAARFAIRPYPSELVQRLDWQGRTLTLRPIRPDDETQHRAFLERLDPQDIRMRVFYSRRSIERSELARLTQIDYEREMAFIATAPAADGGEETLGVVRALCDPNNQDAEFGVIVRSDLKGQGLGRCLMHKMIGYLRQRRTQRLVGQVLRENTPMLALMQQLGFVVESAPEDAGMLVVSLTLALLDP
jgi:acetyltransferase